MTETTILGVLKGPADVFISYSREDSARILALVERLQAHGITAWVDQKGIAGGTRWREEIVNAITSSKVFLFVASRDSFASENVSRELSIASEENKHILAVFLEEVEVPASYRYQLAELQHLKLYGVDEDESFQAILRALKKLGANPSAKPLAPLSSAPVRPARRRRRAPSRRTLLLGLPAAALLALAGYYIRTVSAGPSSTARHEHLGLLLGLPKQQIHERLGLRVRHTPAAAPGSQAAAPVDTQVFAVGGSWSVYLPRSQDSEAELRDELRALGGAWGVDWREYTRGPALDLAPGDRLEVELLMLARTLADEPLRPQPSPSGDAIRFACKDFVVPEREATQSPVVAEMLGECPEGGDR